jgi:hypothetical protein
MLARGNPTSPELNYLSAKLVPFRQAASILEELLPVAETVNAGITRGYRAAPPGIECSPRRSCVFRSVFIRG